MGILSTIAAAVESKKGSPLIPKSGWGSRKLWIFAGVALTLVWLGRGNLSAILEGLIWLTGVYLVTQVIQDVGEAFATAWVTREKLRCDTQVTLAAPVSKPEPPAVIAAP